MEVLGVEDFTILIIMDMAMVTDGAALDGTDITIPTLVALTGV